MPSAGYSELANWDGSLSSSWHDSENRPSTVGSMSRSAGQLSNAKSTSLPHHLQTVDSVDTRIFIRRAGKDATRANEKVGESSTNQGKLPNFDLNFDILDRSYGAGNTHDSHHPHSSNSSKQQVYPSYHDSLASSSAPTRRISHGSHYSLSQPVSDHLGEKATKKDTDLGIVDHAHNISHDRVAPITRRLPSSESHRNKETTRTSELSTTFNSNRSPGRRQHADIDPSASAKRSLFDKINDEDDEDRVDLLLLNEDIPNEEGSKDVDSSSLVDMNETISVLELQYPRSPALDAKADFEIELVEDDSRSASLGGPISTTAGRGKQPALVPTEIIDLTTSPAPSDQSVELLFTPPSSPRASFHRRRLSSPRPPLLSRPRHSLVRPKVAAYVLVPPLALGVSASDYVSMPILKILTRVEKQPEQTQTDQQVRVYASVGEALRAALDNNAASGSLVDSHRSLVATTSSHVDKHRPQQSHGPRPDSPGAFRRSLTADASFHVMKDPLQDNQEVKRPGSRPRKRCLEDSVGSLGRSPKRRKLQTEWKTVPVVHHVDRAVDPSEESLLACWPPDVDRQEPSSSTNFILLSATRHVHHYLDGGYSPERRPDTMHRMKADDVSLPDLALEFAVSPLRHVDTDYTLISPSDDATPQSPAVKDIDATLGEFTTYSPVNIRSNFDKSSYEDPANNFFLPPEPIPHITLRLDSPDRTTQYLTLSSPTNAGFELQDDFQMMDDLAEICDYTGEDQYAAALGGNDTAGFRDELIAAGTGTIDPSLLGGGGAADLPAVRSPSPSPAPSSLSSNKSTLGKGAGATDVIDVPVSESTRAESSRPARQRHPSRRYFQSPNGGGQDGKLSVRRSASTWDPMDLEDIGMDDAQQDESSDSEYGSPSTQRPVYKEKRKKGPRTVLLKLSGALRNSVESRESSRGKDGSAGEGGARRKARYDEYHAVIDVTACHHCRRTTAHDKMRCTSVTAGGERCGKRFCCVCIEKRYPDIAFDPYFVSFICPVCTDTCNCSYCSRKRGEEYVSERRHGGYIQVLKMKNMQLKASPEDPQAARVAKTVTRSTDISSTLNFIPASSTMPASGTIKHYWGTVYGLTNAEKVGVVIRPSSDASIEAASRTGSPVSVLPKRRTFIGAIQPAWKLSSDTPIKDVAFPEDRPTAGEGKGKEKETDASVVRTYVGARSVLFLRHTSISAYLLHDSLSPLTQDDTPSVSMSPLSSLTSEAEDDEPSSEGTSYNDEYGLCIPTDVNGEWLSGAIAECFPMEPSGGIHLSHEVVEQGIMAALRFIDMQPSL